MSSNGLTATAPEHATTSFTSIAHNIAHSSKRVSNALEKLSTTTIPETPIKTEMQTWSTETTLPRDSMSTMSNINNPVDCCHQIEGEADLAQSFVLYFAPVVIGLAIIMCVARLLFNYCTFRALSQPESSLCSSASHTQNITRSHRHTHHIHTVDHRSCMIPYERNDSLAQIFQQVPPPNYEQTQKYGRSVALPIDQPPPPYLYENSVCLDNERSASQRSASHEQVSVISSPSLPSSQSSSNQQRNSVSPTINPSCESNTIHGTINGSSQIQSNEQINPIANPPSYTSVFR